MNDLPKGLDLFNRDSRVMALKVVNDLRENKSPTLNNAIESALEGYLEYFIVEATSYHYFDEEIEGAEIQSWWVDPDRVNVVSSDDASFTMLVDVDAKIEFQAHFSFSHYDSVDREYIPLAGTHAAATRNVRIRVTITVYKDDLDDPEPHEVEVESPTLTVYFGEVEPDWS